MLEMIFIYGTLVNAYIKSFKKFLFICVISSYFECSFFSQFGKVARMCFDLVWFDCVLWQIYPCGLFNAEYVMLYRSKEPIHSETEVIIY